MSNRMGSFSKLYWMNDQFQKGFFMVWISEQYERHMTSKRLLLRKLKNTEIELVTRHQNHLKDVSLPCHLIVE